MQSVGPIFVSPTSVLEGKSAGPFAFVDMGLLDGICIRLRSASPRHSNKPISKSEPCPSSEWAQRCDVEVAMSRSFYECTLDRILCFGRISFCSIAIFFVSIALAAGQQQQSGSPAAVATQTRQQLPPDLAKEVAGSEASIREALHKVDDPALIAAAIPKAEHVLQIRASHQGDSWWQTIHAREDLADLRRLSAMSDGERASLAAAERAAEQVQIRGLAESSKNDQVIDILLATARTEGQILGEEHPWYAVSLYRVGRAYYAQFRYTESESYYLRALDIHRKNLGEEEPVYASDLIALAELYNSTNRYEEAEPLYLQALAIEKRTL